MPVLNLIDCSVHLGSSPDRLQEVFTSYGNSRTECYVCSVGNDMTFSVKCKTTGFIGQGIAAFVFLDGVYQANRNQLGVHSVNQRDSTSVEFIFRQKEEWDRREGTIIGREWKFSDLDTVSEQSSTADMSILGNLGTIEVVILRCKGSSSSRVNATDVRDATTIRRPTRQSYERIHTAVDHSRRSSVLNYKPTETRSSSKSKNDEMTYTAWKASKTDQTGPAIVGLKSYWSQWNPESTEYNDEQNTASRIKKLRDPYSTDAYQSAKICAQFASNCGVNAKATTGKGARYMIPRATPEYIDDMTAPYAIFTFYYRSHAFLSNAIQAMSYADPAPATKIAVPEAEPSQPATAMNPISTTTNDANFKNTSDNTSASKSVEISTNQQQGETKWTTVEDDPVKLIEAPWAGKDPLVDQGVPW